MPVVKLKDPPAGLSKRIEVQANPKRGGEGEVFFSRDGKHAVKVFHKPHAEEEQMLLQVMAIFHSLPPNQEKFILPPLALVDSLDGQKRVGFIMRRVPPHYEELLEMVMSPIAAARQFQQGKRWSDFLKVARSLTHALGVLHAKGCAHSDVAYRNFMANLDEGHAVMLESDGIVVAGFKEPKMAGSPGFMAPEILMDGVRPNLFTDRHSLAVLVLHTLLFRNVMEPIIEYADEQTESDRLGWGRYALFSEHPQDRRHRPRQVGIPLYQKGALSYLMLTPALKRLTESALIDNLRVPDKRPTSRQWESALACAMDEIWMCHRCRQHFPYPYWLAPAARRACPFCGERVQSHPVILELYEKRSQDNYHAIGRKVLLGPGFKIFPDVAEPGWDHPPLTRRGAIGLGHVVWDKAHGQYRLVNDEGGRWTARSQDGTKRFAAGKDESLPLAPGHFIHFGEGRRLAVVMPM